MLKNFDDPEFQHTEPTEWQRQDLKNAMMRGRARATYIDMTDIMGPDPNNPIIYLKELDEE